MYRIDLVHFYLVFHTATQLINNTKGEQLLPTFGCFCAQILVYIIERARKGWLVNWIADITHGIILILFYLFI